MCLYFLLLLYFCQIKYCLKQLKHFNSRPKTDMFKLPILLKTYSLESEPEFLLVIIRFFDDDTSNDIHSPGPVIWEVSP